MIVLAFITGLVIVWMAAYWAGWQDHAEALREKSRRRHPSDRPLTAMWCIACPDRPRVADPVAHSRLFHGSRTTGPDDDDEWLAGL